MGPKTAEVTEVAHMESDSNTDSECKVVHHSGSSVDPELGIGSCEVIATPHEQEVDSIRAKYAWLGRLHQVEVYLGGAVGIEAMGAERVPEDQRHPPNLVNMILLWFTLNLSPGFLVIGAIGLYYGLSVNETIAISFAAVILGSIPPAWTATLCPQTGLRQIAVSRFTLGIFGSKIASFMNAIINIGFGVTNAIVGGQLLVAASPGGLSQILGIVLLIVLSWLLSVFGFRVMHMFLKHIWIINFIVVCALWGQSAKYWPEDRSTASTEGAEHTGGGLTYFTIVFGSTAAWSTISGDYYVHFPTNTNRMLVFGLTYVGMMLPLAFCVPLGVLVGGAIVANEEMAVIYGSGNLGGIVDYIMTPAAWGKTVCVLMFLSTIGGEAVIFYSSALSFQLLSKWIFAVPRFVWSCIAAGVCLFLSLGGRDSLSEIIASFNGLLGYWALPFVVVQVLEYYIFRPRLGGWKLAECRNPKAIPLGIAGTVSLLVGFGMSFLGMTQTWVVGPLALLVSDSGGDVGDYLAIGVPCLIYLPLRILELKFVGR